MADGFRLRLFGPPALLDDGGRAVHFRAKKQLALLVFLHFEARTHPVGRDALVDLLWPEVSAHKGRHSLSQALSAVRAHLGEHAVSARTDTVGLVAPLLTELDLMGAGADEVVDVANPLRDLDKCAGADFGHWVDSARERILSAARERLAAGLREARSRGDLAGVARRALLLHCVDPVNPAAVIALAERGLLDGDTIGAMRILREYLRRVEQELGANPHPEITGLLRRLERGEGPAIEASGPFSGIARPRREVFVGREQELEQLEAWWQRGREVSCLTGLVTGVAGIGKSSLIRRFATSVAARTNPVFVVTCQEIGSGIPFAAVSDLILAIGRDPDASGTEPLWLAEASRVSPGLRAAYPGIPEPPQAPAESVRLRVAEALVRMIESVAEGSPALVVFDDVQHMDPASRDVLFLFTRRLEQLHVVLIGTLRTAEAHRAPAGEGASETLGWQEALELSRLAEGQVKELIEGLSVEVAAPDEGIRATIAGLAQGNPYHVEMLLSDWRQHASGSLVAAESTGDATAAAWKPPETLRLAFARQYKGLSADAQHVLHLLAVAGKALATTEIAGLLRLGTDAVDRIVLEVIDRGFLRVDGGPFYFKNELHRAYVYYAMAEDVRKYFHARLGESSGQRRTPGDFQWRLEASHHLIRAGMREEAIGAAIAGAELAMARGAPKEAERALRALIHAYSNSCSRRINLLLAKALAMEGQYRGSLDALSSWRPESSTPSETATAAVLRADALQRGRLADDGAIREAADEAVTLAERANDQPNLVLALQIKAEAASDAGDLAAVREAGHDAGRIAMTTSNSESKALAGITTGFTALTLGDLHLASKMLSESGPLLEELGLYVDYRRSQNGLGIAFTGLGHVDEAISAFRRAIRVAEQLGNPVALANTWANLASLYHEVGSFADAVECYRTARRELRAGDSVRVSCELCAGATVLALVLGSFAEALDLADLCQFEAARSGSWRHRIVALLAQADVHLSRREQEFAWPLVEEAIHHAADRSYMLAEAGQFGRLHRHFVWATKGYDAMLAIAGTAMHLGAYRRVADSLEIDLFEESVRALSGKDESDQSALAKVRRTRLYGALARVLASNVHHPLIPQPRDGETSAQLVARVFLESDAGSVPKRVFPPEQVGERPSYA